MEVDETEIVAPTNEQYLVLRAKNALNYDSYEAKSWMLTAQTLFPQNFGVQFEAYQIEKSSRNIKEAAKCFASLIFPEEQDLWVEIKAITAALRLTEDENEVMESSFMSETEFLRQLFNHVPKNIQHALLLTCAEKTPDNMEHSTLMLLLFNKFPETIVKYGPRLMENLITAEKHSLLQNNPVNCYRKLLVCDLLPLLGSDQLDLQLKNLYRLLHKAIEFYLCYLFNNKKKEDLDYLKIDDPWVRLWEIMLNIGSKLAWDLSITFASYWNKDNYWTALINFYQTKPSGNDDHIQKQIVYCATLILVRCLNEYLSAVEPNSERAYVLVEAFCKPYPPNEALPKRSRHEEDINQPALTAGSTLPSGVLHSFITAVRCWDLLHINEPIEKGSEFYRLMGHLKLETWLKNFQLDLTLYKGNYEQLKSLLMNVTETDCQAYSLGRDLLLLCSYYFTQNFSPIIDIISKVASSLPEATPVTNNDFSANRLTVASRQSRHLHFLPLTRMSILQYCVKILLAALKVKKNELTLGHILVLIQLDTPVEEELLNEITTTIQHRGGFSYPIFTSYIINVDVLEQFAFLSSDQGSKIPLDILPPGQQLHNQRRMSTRGVDKGVKEDIKMAIRRQVTRSNEPIDAIIIKFLTRERELIYHSLVDS
ncbi:hypothetical protein RUM43_000650 [Polyplax serrata]|uniref:Integrator complex subunit 10 n=1 Tax=Polyplax serrata TaxID=468196 RepID=A0AAN8SCP5_POLSC